MKNTKTNGLILILILGSILICSCSNNQSIKTPGWLRGIWKNDNAEIEVLSDNIEISDAFTTVSLYDLVDSSFSNYLDEESQKLVKWKQSSNSNKYELTVINKDTGWGAKLIAINKNSDGTIKVTIAGKDMGTLTKQ